MRRPAAIVALTLAAVLFTAAPVASLVATAAGDLSVQPGADATLDTETGNVRVSVQPGGGVWQSAVVTNRGRQRFTVTLEGTEWLHPAVDSVLLEPGQSETVRFTVAPPVDAEGGETVVTLTAAIEGQTDAARSLDVVVTVLGAVSPTPLDARTEPASGAATEADATASGAPSSGGPDLFLLIAIVGGIALLLLGLLVPPIVQGVKRRRELRVHMSRMHNGVLTRIDARRIRRIVECAAAIGEMPRVPDKPTRADVKRAVMRRRAAERHKVVRSEQAHLRQEAYRFAAALWNERVRRTREAAERERAERTQRIEHARRERVELAASLAAEREAAEEQRRERTRHTEEQRRADVAQRAQERAEQTTVRRSERRAAARRAAEAVREHELTRQLDAESERTEVVQERSAIARRRAVAWGGAVEAALRAQTARTPPVPGEEGGVRPGGPRAPLAFLDPLTGEVARPARHDVNPTNPETAPPAPIDVTALDIDELNRQLAAAPSQGTRTASAQRRSSP